MEAVRVASCTRLSRALLLSKALPWPTALCTVNAVMARGEGVPG